MQHAPSPSPPISLPLTGKGRGLVATQPLAKGDLVMVSEPLAVIWGEPWSAEQPDSEQLYSYMIELKQYSARDLQLMAAMFNGTPESLEVPQESVLQEVSSSAAEGGAPGTSRQGVAQRLCCHSCRAQGPEPSAARTV
jgi:hypothetical protein